MKQEELDAIEYELCTCRHPKTDHHGAFGDGACSVVTLAAIHTPPGHCACKKFAWKAFIWKPGQAPPGKP